MILNKKTRDFLTYSLGLLDYRKSVTFLDIFCNAVIFCRMAAITFIVRQVFNIIEKTQGSALRLAMPYLFAVLAVVLIRVAAIMGCATLDTIRAYHYQNRVRVNVLRLLLKKSDINGVAGRSGPVFEVLGNDIPISTFPAELLTEVTGYFIFTLIALFMLLSVNWQLTLFIFIPLSAAIYGIQRLSQRMKERRQANRNAQDAASGFIADMVDSSLAVKASGAEEPVLKRFELVNKNRRTAVLKDTLLNARISFLLNGSVYAGSAIMMFAAARLMTNGSFGLGDFSLFIANMGTLAECVNRIVELIAESRRAEVSYERIMEISGAENSMTLNMDAGISLGGRIHLVPKLPGEKFGTNLNSSVSGYSVSGYSASGYSRKPLESFEARNLSFDYGENTEQELRGFSNISFRTGPGRLLTVNGEIGSGKSTLLDVMMGLMQPDSGICLLDNRPLNEIAVKPLETAGTPQRAGIFSGSLRENISLGFPASDDEILNALSLAALDEFARSQCLNMDLGSRGDKLSGGQKQRLALARLFLRSAKLLLIDDCVSALDDTTRKKALRRMLSYLEKTGATVIIVTNDPEFTNAASAVLYMKQGQGFFRDISEHDVP